MTNQSAALGRTGKFLAAHGGRCQSPDLVLWRKESAVATFRWRHFWRPNDSLISLPCRRVSLRPHAQGPSARVRCRNWQCSRKLVDRKLIERANTLGVKASGEPRWTKRLIIPLSATFVASAF